MRDDWRCRICEETERREQVRRRLRRVELEAKALREELQSLDRRVEQRHQRRRSA